MTKKRATGKFKLKDWDEKPYDEVGPKMTRVQAVVTYEGEMEGEGKLQYLMMYREDETASYVSMERFSGRIGGREGSVVLQGTGEFKNGAAAVDWTVVPGSGTGDLRGINGKGGFKSIHGDEETEVELEYEI